MTTDPKKLTRKDFARIVGDDLRAIRAFEKLFELVPGDIDEAFVLGEVATLMASAARNATDTIAQQVQQLEMTVRSLRQFNDSNLKFRIEQIEAQLETIRNYNDQILKDRVSFLEAQVSRKVDINDLERRLSYLEAEGHSKPAGWDRLLNRVEILEGIEGL